MKTWNVGDVLTAADMNAWAVPLGVVKPSDTSRSSTTTMTPDPHLVLAVAANASYFLQGYIDYEAAVSVDLKMAFTVPSGAGLRWAPWFVSTSPLTLEGAGVEVGGTIVAGGNGAGVSYAVMLKGSLVTAAAAGNLSLTWAQNVSNGTATKVHAGSAMMLQRTA